MGKRSFFLLFSFFAAGYTYPQAMQPVSIESRWRDTPIIIDGKDDDWQKRSIAVGTQKMVVDIANDETHLYLYVHTWDKRLTQIMILKGFTVWFENPDAGKLGIRFPVGLASDPKFQAAANDQGKLKKYLDQSNDLMNHMEVVEPDGGKKINSTLQYFQQQGISAAIAAPDGNLVYELKIPLIKRPDHPYAVGSQDTKRFRLYFDFPFAEMNSRQPDSSAPDDTRPHGMHGGGMHGVGMHGGGIHGNDTGEQRTTAEQEQPGLYQMQAEPILDADVSLAAA